MAIFKLKKMTLSFWSALHFIILLTMLVFAVLFSDSQHTLRLALQNGVFDQFNKWYPREAGDDVIIVDVDEPSLHAIGQWPWPRNIMAKLVESLTEKGATVIAFDGVFAEKDRSSPLYFLAQLPEEKSKQISHIFTDDQSQVDYDQVFAQAIKDSERFVTAFTYGRSERAQNAPLDKKRILAKNNVKEIFLNHASYFEAAAINLPIFAENAAGNGSFMARPDHDGVLRRAGMVFTDRKSLYPSYNLEALRVHLSGRKGTIKIADIQDESKKQIDTQFRILVGDKKIPVEKDGILYVYYRHFCSNKDLKNTPQLCPKQKADYISAYQLLDESYAEKMRERVNGKIILIGASAEGLLDLRSTPLRPFRPGVEVHANVIEQVLSDNYLLRPDITKGAEALFILAGGAFFIIVSPFIGIILSILLCATIVGVAMYGALFMYLQNGILLDPVYPSASVVAIFVVSTILSYARAEIRRKQIRNAFGMYVAPDVMRDLEANPDKLQLGGELREITVMFTDIRRFTSISEGMTPEELIHLMNEFLTGMTDIVMEHKGTVDKYIGDAMMTFWNAPRDVDDHERQACLAALKMQNALEPVNEEIKARAKKLGKEPILLEAGIGINTGECAVGNMGSKQRFAYSALGDAVNLSSRLEGQTKAYGVSIIIGESTAQKAQDLAILELDLIRVVGKEQPARIYALIGDDKLAQTQDFINWKQAHEKFLTAYRNKDFKDALSSIKDCEKYALLPQNALYEMYKARIKELKNAKLPDNWDGVYVAMQK